MISDAQAEMILAQRALKSRKQRRGRRSPYLLSGHPPEFGDSESKKSIVRTLVASASLDGDDLTLVPKLPRNNWG